MEGEPPYSNKNDRMVKHWIIFGLEVLLAVALNSTGGERLNERFLEILVVSLIRKLLNS